LRESRDALRQLLRLVPDDADALELMSDNCLETEDWSEALRHLEALQNVVNESSTRWTKIGVARLMLGEDDGAREAWNRAVTLEPGNQAAAAHLMGALEERLASLPPRRYAVEGLRLIQEMAERLPGHFGPPLSMAKYFFALRDRKRGLAAIERALELGADAPHAWAGSLAVLIAYGKDSDVRRLRERAASSQPHNPALQMEIGIALLDHDKPKHAPKHFSLALRFSRSAAIPLEIARAYIENKRYDEGARYLEMALEREPGHCEANAALALVWATLGDERTQRQLDLARKLAREAGDSESLLMVESAGEVVSLHDRMQNLFDL
ncbi:MAG: tetratricopeptide repeat protein, partial [Acidobacteria bacterium]|nr:tetratricopeptide repeat protein [Acidobacteriota bacterium]